MKMQRGRALSFGLVILVVAGRGIWGQEKSQAGKPAAALQKTADYRGGLVSPPIPKPKFTLTDTDGKPFDFAAKTEGYVTFLFFGYAHCPDICPSQMALIAQALKDSPPELAKQFKVVFVTTDPDRDTRQDLRTWLDHFDRRFIGLTGTQPAIDAAQTAANLSPATRSSSGPDTPYEVGHAAFVLAYTRDNLARVIYPAGITEKDLVHDLPLLAKGSS
jgi:protein SCO1/2